MRQKLHDFLVLEEATLHADPLCPTGSQFPECLILRPLIHAVLIFPVSSSSESDGRMQLTRLWPRLPSKADPCVETMPDVSPWLRLFQLSRDTERMYQQTCPGI